jgi:vancomycin resistance protein YoaR
MHNSAQLKETSACDRWDEPPLADAKRTLDHIALAVGIAIATVPLLVVLLANPASARAAARGEAALEPVSSFTTPFRCCPPRVRNIRRAAQLLDGRLIAERARFSMNGALGRRTRARGFVPAPMISGGRLVDSVGGGISQVATTLFNAAFFAGLRLVAHTPHSFYITRYPMGREATISWGGPELIFDNDWSAPLRMRLHVSSKAITVKFYSAELGRRVQSWSGRPYAYQQPSTRIVHNPGLPLGARRVVQQAGPPGFTIDYGRRIYRDGRLVRNERWRHRYQPEDRIIEVGTR